MRMKGWQSTIDNLLQSDAFPKNSNAKVLELGSGAGDSLLPLAEKGYQVTGIEISPTAVSWAREKFDVKGLNGNFVEGNIAKPLPFFNEYFDAILDAACLHCIIGFDRDKVLNEVRRVLKPGGFLLISHMVNDPHELSAEFSFNSTKRVQERGGIPYRSMPTYEYLADELMSNGFKIIKTSIRQNPWWDHAEFWCSKSNN